MNILIVSSEIPVPLLNGARIIVFNLIKRLSGANKITLLTFGDLSKDASRIAELNKYCAVETVSSEAKNLLFERILSLFFLIPFGVRICRSGKFNNKLRGLLRHNKYDLLICFYLNTAQYGYGIGNIPKIIYAVDCDSLIYMRRRNAERNPIRKLYYSWQGFRYSRYQRIYYKYFSAAIVVSDVDRQELLKTNPALPVHVLANGVDIDYYTRSDMGSYDGFIIFTGVMSYHPNVASVHCFYNNILPIVRKTFPGLIFYIVGRNPDISLKKLTDSDKNVIVTGYVPDMRPYLEKCRALVCYMVSGSGIKNKILEAMSMEVPVVANSFAMTGIDAANNFECLIGDTYYDFARKVVSLLSDDNMAKQIGANSRAYVIKNHGWKNVAEKALTIFGTVT